MNLAAVRLDDIAARPMPESIRQLTRERPCFVSEQPRNPFPLCNAEGVPWWKVKADKEKTA